MSHNRRICTTIAALACGAAPVRSYAQAYCALRDPVRQVYEMFPDATSYRSIVRAVENRARKEVTARLPFELHHNELGRHTLYVAVREKVPLGLVHVRSEASEWGLVEIAWAFDLDLRVVDYRFQRCRDPQRSIVASDAVRTQLQGKGYAELHAMLSTQSPSGGLVVPQGASGLAAVLLRSALKTMVVTEASWAQDLRLIRLLARSHAAFPSAKRAQLIENPYGEGRADEAHVRLKAEMAGIDRKTVDVVRVADAHGSTVGFTVRTNWKPAGDACVLWWSVSPDGTILTVDAVGASCSPEIMEPLASLAGTTTARLASCATAAELAALEVLRLCRQSGWAD